MLMQKMMELYERIEDPWNSWKLATALVPSGLHGIHGTFMDSFMNSMEFHGTPWSHFISTDIHGPYGFLGVHGPLISMDSISFHGLHVSIDSRGYHNFH